MDRLWKYLMHLDAKALFFGSVALFVVILTLVVWLYLHRTSAASQTQRTVKSAVNTDYRPIGVLEIVSNQMAANSLVVPINPFRACLENMPLLPIPTPPPATTNLPYRWPLSRTNLTGRVRPPANTGGSSAPVVPTITFSGFFSRPDGTPAALFHDSANNSNLFLTPGCQIRDVSLISANIRTARVQKVDGQTIDLAIGESFTLPAVKP